jgi:hypothetical protein
MKRKKNRGRERKGKRRKTKKTADKILRQNTSTPHFPKKIKLISKTLIISS